MPSVTSGNEYHSPILGFSNGNNMAVFEPTVVSSGGYHFLYGPSHLGDLESDSGNESDLTTSADNTRSLSRSKRLKNAEYAIPNKVRPQPIMYTPSALKHKITGPESKFIPQSYGYGGEDPNRNYQQNMAVIDPLLMQGSVTHMEAGSTDPGRQVTIMDSETEFRPACKETTRRPQSVPNRVDIARWKKDGSNEIGNNSMHMADDETNGSEMRMTVVSQSSGCKVLARQLTRDYVIQDGGECYTPDNSTLVQFTALVPGKHQVQLAWSENTSQEENGLLFSIQKDNIMLKSSESDLYVTQSRSDKSKSQHSRPQPPKSSYYKQIEKLQRSSHKTVHGGAERGVRESTKTSRPSVHDREDGDEINSRSYSKVSSHYNSKSAASLKKSSRIEAKINTASPHEHKSSRNEINTASQHEHKSRISDQDRDSSSESSISESLFAESASGKPSSKQKTIGRTGITKNMPKSERHSERNMDTVSECSSESSFTESEIDTQSQNINSRVRIKSSEKAIYKENKSVRSLKMKSESLSGSESDSEIESEMKNSKAKMSQKISGKTASKNSVHRRSNNLSQGSQSSSSQSSSIPEASVINVRIDNTSKGEAGLRKGYVHGDGDVSIRRKTGLGERIESDSDDSDSQIQPLDLQAVCESSSNESSRRTEDYADMQFTSTSEDSHRITTDSLNNVLDAQSSSSESELDDMNTDDDVSSIGSGTSEDSAVWIIKPLTWFHFASKKDEKFAEGDVICNKKNLKQTCDDVKMEVTNVNLKDITKGLKESSSFDPGRVKGMTEHRKSVPISIKESSHLNSKNENESPQIKEKSAKTKHIPQETNSASGKKQSKPRTNEPSPQKHAPKNKDKKCDDSKLTYNSSVPLRSALSSTSSLSSGHKRKLSVTFDLPKKTYASAVKANTGSNQSGSTSDSSSILDLPLKHGINDKPSSSQTSTSSDYTYGELLPFKHGIHDSLLVSTSKDNLKEMTHNINKSRQQPSTVKTKPGSSQSSITSESSSEEQLPVKHGIIDSPVAKAKSGLKQRRVPPESNYKEDFDLKQKVNINRAQTGKKVSSKSNEQMPSNQLASKTGNSLDPWAQLHAKISLDSTAHPVKNLPSKENNTNDKLPRNPLPSNTSAATTLDPWAQLQTVTLSNKNLPRKKEFEKANRTSSSSSESLMCSSTTSSTDDSFHQAGGKEDTKLAGNVQKSNSPSSGSSGSATSESSSEEYETSEKAETSQLGDKAPIKANDLPSNKLASKFGNTLDPWAKLHAKISLNKSLALASNNLINKNPTKPSEELPHGFLSSKTSAGKTLDPWTALSNNHLPSINVEAKANGSITSSQSKPNKKHSSMRKLINSSSSECSTSSSANDDIHQVDHKELIADTKHASKGSSNECTTTSSGHNIYQASKLAGKSQLSNSSSSESSVTSTTEDNIEEENHKALSLETKVPRKRKVFRRFRNSQETKPDASSSSDVSENTHRRVRHKIYEDRNRTDKPVDSQAVAHNISTTNSSYSTFDSSNIAIGRKTGSGMPSIENDVTTNAGKYDAGNSPKQQIAKQHSTDAAKIDTTFQNALDKKQSSNVNHTSGIKTVTMVTSESRDSSSDASEDSTSSDEDEFEASFHRKQNNVIMDTEPVNMPYNSEECKRGTVKKMYSSSGSRTSRTGSEADRSSSGDSHQGIKSDQNENLKPCSNAVKSSDESTDETSSESSGHSTTDETGTSTESNDHSTTDETGTSTESSGHSTTDETGSSTESNDHSTTDETGTSTESSGHSTTDETGTSTESSGHSTTDETGTSTESSGHSTTVETGTSSDISSSGEDRHHNKSDEKLNLEIQKRNQSKDVKGDCNLNQNMTGNDVINSMIRSTLSSAKRGICDSSSSVSYHGYSTNTFTSASTSDDSKYSFNDMNELKSKSGIASDVEKITGKNRTSHAWEKKQSNDTNCQQNVRGTKIEIPEYSSSNTYTSTSASSCDDSSTSQSSLSNENTGKLKPQGKAVELNGGVSDKTIVNNDKIRKSESETSDSCSSSSSGSGSQKLTNAVDENKITPVKKREKQSKVCEDNSDIRDTETETSTAESHSSSSESHDQSLSNLKIERAIHKDKKTSGPTITQQCTNPLAVHPLGRRSLLDPIQTPTFNLKPLPGKLPPLRANMEASNAKKAAEYQNNQKSHNQFFDTPQDNLAAHMHLNSGTSSESSESSNSGTISTSESSESSSASQKITALE